MTEPVFRYCIPGNSGFLNPMSFLWNMPLSEIYEDRCNDRAVCNFLLKDYFESAKIFIAQNKYKALKRGMKFYCKKDISCADISYINISLEKHGAFYHPAKISVILRNDKRFFFVLNIASSDAGLAIIRNEYRVLSKLNKDQPNSWLPEVFAIGIIPRGNGVIAFFMAQWFEGFHEFHITPFTTEARNGEIQNKEEQIGLWESDGTISKISLSSSLVIYERAAEILTDFYNIKTFEQIFPWHHAAGDFVIKKTGDDFSVRLITARGYSTLFEIVSDNKNTGNNNLDNEEILQEDILQGLLFFLLNLSLRMRIDRMDGTGKYYFMDSGIISSVLKGFFRVISKKYIPKVSEKNTGEIFLEFVMNFNAEEIYEMLAMIADSYNPDAPEVALIKKNLKKHSKILFNEIRTM